LISPEPEFKGIFKLVGKGETVVDVGANVGQYTLRLAECVQTYGRVLAFEPVPETFGYLANNVVSSGYRNITLFNAACSSDAGVFSMVVPSFESGLSNHYQSHISRSSDGDFCVLGLRLDALGIKERISLIKIDAEGHDYQVLLGAREVLVRDHPIVIFESGSANSDSLMGSIGYRSCQLNGSPNKLYWCAWADARVKDLVDNQ